MRIIHRPRGIIALVDVTLVLRLVCLRFNLTIGRCL
jgi:hypothetical protein